VVWPDDDDGGKRRIGFKRPGGGRKGGGDDDDGDDKGGDLKGMVLDSVVSAQDTADRAQKEVEKLKGKFEACTAVWEAQREKEVVETERSIAEAEQKIKDSVLQMHENFARAQQLQHRQETCTLFESLANVRGQLNCLAARITDSSGGAPGGAVAMDTNEMEEMRRQLQRMATRIEDFSASVFNDIMPRINADVTGVVDGRVQAISAQLAAFGQGMTALQQSFVAQGAQLAAIQAGVQTAVDAAIAPINAGIAQAQKYHHTGMDSCISQIESILQTIETMQTSEYDIRDKVLHIEAQITDLAKSFSNLSRDVNSTPAHGQSNLDQQLQDAIRDMQSKMAADMAAKIVETNVDLTRSVNTMGLIIDELRDNYATLADQIDEMTSSDGGYRLMWEDVDNTPSRPTSALSTTDGVQESDRPPSARKRKVSDTPGGSRLTQEHQQQKFAEMVKHVTDAYLKQQQTDLDAKIDKKVRDAWVQEQTTHIRMEVDGAPPAAVPADITPIERRLRRLEQLFLETAGVDTIDPATQPAFAAPPPLPGTGNFAAPPGVI
jgi:Mg2+ and Co2+ transporter CorA